MANIEGNNGNNLHGSHEGGERPAESKSSLVDGLRKHTSRAGRLLAKPLTAIGRSIEERRMRAIVRSYHP